MISGIGNKIKVWDSLGNWPSIKNEYMTLDKIDGIYLTFTTNTGKSITYPEQRKSENMYTRTVVCDSTHKFDQYAMWMSLKHKIDIPPL